MTIGRDGDFPDLIGFRPVPVEHRVDWTRLFDADGTRTAQRAKKLDGRSCVVDRAARRLDGRTRRCGAALPCARDLARGQGVGLPSGEAVAHSARNAAIGDEWRKDGGRARNRRLVLRPARPRPCRAAIASVRSAATLSAKC